MPQMILTKVIKNLVVLALLVSFPIISFTQIRGQYWKKFKNEFYFGGGSSHYLGDLGGGIESGTHSLAHLNVDATHFIFSGGWRSKLTEGVSFRLNFEYGYVSGADSLTENLGRRSRNLSFRTTIFSVAPLIEVYIIPEQFGRHANPFSAYIASGIKLVYYNPMAEYDGQWYSLRPLGTEGQLLAGNTPYSKIAAGIPLVFGFKYALPSARGGKSGSWVFGFEASANWLFTDYLDDVSTTYYDPEAIRSTSGDIGVILADRRLTSTKGSVGGIRGKPTHDDWYGALQITVGKHIYGRSGRRRRPPKRATFY